MFDDLRREARRLSGAHSYAVPIPSDGEGYFDRECPSPECLAQFRIHEDDWRDKVRNEEVFCAFCGHAAPSDKWWTQEQLERAKTAALGQIQQRLGDAMRRDARRWNSRQPRNSFVRMTFSVRDGDPVVLPPAVADPMRLKISCPACACRYAVVGAAFFCPACGHNAADMMFAQSIAGLRGALDTVAAIRAAIDDKDTAETTGRMIVENGLQNAVTAFQRYAEALHGKTPSASRPRRNAFQSLEEGSALWFGVTGKRYTDYLDSGEIALLVRAFQQRHLLAHRQGLVDEAYLKRTGDTTYRPGQRIAVRESTVRECLTLIEKLAAAMTAAFPPSRPFK